jgi:DNA-binding NarL/FixJ family response regulator
MPFLLSWNMFVVANDDEARSLRVEATAAYRLSKGVFIINLPGKVDQVNVAIILKSRVLSEALVQFLRRECSDDRITVESPVYANVLSGKPDVVLMDHHSLTSDFVTSYPAAKLILLDTGLTQEEVVTLMLIHRLQGVIGFDEDPDLLKKALRIVDEGQIWINNCHLKTLMFKAGDISRNGRIDSISKREHDVLELIAQGKKNKEIAAQLFMSEQTVKAHISHIFKKCNVTSRTQLVSHLMTGAHDNLKGF